MEERLDQLFKNKLTGHKVTPTDNAWEQISGQLSNKRKKIWTRRIAVAASLLILISAGVTGYLYIDQLEVATPTVTDSRISESLIADEQTEAKDEISVAEETNSEIADQGQKSPLPTIVQETKAQEVEQTKLNEDDKSDNQSPLAMVEYNDDVDNEVKIMESALLEAEEIPAVTEELLAESTVVNPEDPETKIRESKANLATETIEENTAPKNYPKVKITYKADNNSDLVASNDRKLINKGIKKISKFSDEHIMTDQVKTKLRNTKDDLLALNFGKLLNKTNKDVDN